MNKLLIIPNVFNNEIIPLNVVCVCSGISNFYCTTNNQKYIRYDSDCTGKCLPSSSQYILCILKSVITCASRLLRMFSMALLFIYINFLYQFKHGSLLTFFLSISKAMHISSGTEIMLLPKYA
jgi:hypothetical protein